MPSDAPDPFDVRIFDPRDEDAVIALWRRTGLTRPWNDPHRDIARKLGEQPDLFLVGCVGGAVVATAMAGYDGHRGWLYYLAVAPEQRGRGYGRRLVRQVERRLAARGCPKLNLMVRSSNPEAVAFYRRIGFGDDAVTTLSRRLIED